MIECGFDFALHALSGVAEPLNAAGVKGSAWSHDGLAASEEGADER